MSGKCETGGKGSNAERVNKLSGLAVKEPITNHGLRISKMSLQPPYVLSVISSLLRSPAEVLLERCLPCLKKFAHREVYDGFSLKPLYCEPFVLFRLPNDAKGD